VSPSVVCSPLPWRWESADPSLPSFDYRGKSRRLTALITAYGLFGFGYVITATFISTMVRNSSDLRSIEHVVWLLVGLAAAAALAIGAALVTYPRGRAVSS